MLTESEVLKSEVKKFLVCLHRHFDSVRNELLQQRKHWRPGLLQETESIRNAEWKVSSAPPDLQDRRIEITGPVDSKIMINALNSGAQIFMADFEDSFSPTWKNLVEGQSNLYEAVRRTLRYLSPDGRDYKLKEQLATLLVRPRGWHLLESNFEVDGSPLSASLFDFGVYFFHNARELILRGSGPYFYLPKLESYKEAGLWNEVFDFSEDHLRLPRGTIKATVLIETLPAAYQMEEILYELKSHAVGLNAGRWNYFFSVIKTFAEQPGLFLPDRSQLTMTLPFMKAYTSLLIDTSHRRGAQAIGGMSTYLSNRFDSQLNERALNQVRQDKEREAQEGFDGSWVAHPDLVRVAREPFDRVDVKKLSQDDPSLDEHPVSQLADFAMPNGRITEFGVANNIRIAFLYLDSWLRGTGAVAVNSLMEDTSTVEIARSELWHWIHTESKLDDGRILSRMLYYKLRDLEVSKLKSDLAIMQNFDSAQALLDQLVLSTHFEEFLTIPAYQVLRSRPFATLDRRAA